MIDKKQLDLIQTLIANLINYVENGRLKTKLQDFIEQDVDNEIDSKEKYIEILYAFIFDQKAEANMTPLEIYLNETENLPDDQKALLNSWKNSIHSIFQVNKTSKDAFHCYNIVNEKEYQIKTLAKFSVYKQIGTNNYIFCRIVPCDDAYVLIGNLINFPYTARKEILEMAVMVQRETPIEMFKDNPAKLEAIYEVNAIKFQKFYDFFSSTEVFTTGENLDEIMTAFSAYFEFGEMDKARIEGKVQKPQELYFDTEIAESLQSNKNIDTYISVFEKCHDVGLVIDQKEGLSILPYYATFTEIFSSDHFKDIKGYKECVQFYLEEESISPAPFVKVITANPVKSVNVFEDVLDQPGFSIQEDFDELMETYKYDYLYNNKLSPTVVYDNSTAFKELLSIYEDFTENIFDFDEEFQKTGRNDPCPCGSGKKFKKCCLNKIKY